MNPIKFLICLIVGHKDHASGDYIMCWRCKSLKRIPLKHGVAGRSVGDPAEVVPLRAKG